MGNLTTKFAAESIAVPFPIRKRKIAEASYENKYFIINDKQFQYYFIDFHETDFNKIMPIIKKCEEIEVNNWNAQENFIDYARKCSALVYAKEGDEIVGFLLITICDFDQYLTYSIDECMVQRGFHGNHIALKLAAIISRISYLKTSKKKGVGNLVFMTATCNPRMIINLYKKKSLFCFVANTFKKSNELLRVHDLYLKRNNLKLVDDEYPFFVKNLFPGSQKVASMAVNLDEIKHLTPPGFDCVKSGDSLMFMAKVCKFSAWSIVIFMMNLMFGWRFWFNNNVGFFRWIKK